MIQRTIRIPPEKIFQKEDGISIRSVVALRATVNTTIEVASDRVIKSGRFQDFSPIDPARIIGSIGSTQGARIVSIPARKLKMRSVIYRS